MAWSYDISSKDKMGHKETYNLKKLLNKAQPFIDYEAKLITLGDYRASVDAGSSRSSRKESNQHKKEGNHNQFGKYTPLNAIEWLIKKCHLCKYTKYDKKDHDDSSKGK